jgi:ketosteroid isomerase-like protein
MTVRFALQSILLAVPAVLAGCSSLTGAAMSTPFDERELRAAEFALARALESSDSTAWVGHYTEDAVFVAPGAPPVQGRAALMQMAKAMQPLGSVGITPLRTEASGHVAAVYSRGTWVTDAQTATPTTTNIRVIIVWRKEHDGRWRVAQELLHAEPPAK